jgi:hypothetical protein
MRIRLFAVISAAATLWVSVAAGHHSPARFDLTQTVTVEGIVARYDFTNPHVYIYLDVVDATGGTVTWELEASSTPNLVRRGWAADSLAIGESVTVRMNPPRDPSQRTARAQSITWRDGRSLAVRGEGSVIGPADTTVSATSLEGIWLGRYGLAQFGTDLDTWPLTVKGREAQANYDGTQNPHIDCIPVAAPSLMQYSNIYVVDITEDRVIIDIEWMNVRRTIYTDGRPHPDSGERSNQGHSVGHWEADTLVVDTRLFADNGAGNAFEIPSGAAKHVVERFTLSADGRNIEYAFVLEDSDYLAAPVRGQGIWDYRPDLTPLPNRCDPEIARRFLQSDE